MSKCKNCGSSEVVSSHGELVCNDCGAVVETSVIVSEVQFQENAAGFSTVVGQFVSYEGGRGLSGTSRQMTIRNARDRIQTIAHQLNMEQHAEMAVKFFKLANSKHLTKGRNSVQVAAACLYIVCRILSKPIMLLDFSDKVKVDVYKLGRIYRYFAKELHIEIPILDPCLYIERYARRLEFGDKTMEVCKTANRLVSSMSRDWMVEGRRPSGICGAALLVAARIFNFNRTIKDVIKVVRIGERTIKNRLKEFEQTESSKLTIDEFNTVNLEQATMDPPCFTAGLKKAKVAELREKDLPLLLEEMEQLKNELEEGIEEMIDRQMKRHKRSLDGTDHTEENLSLSSVAPTMEALEEELAQYEDLLNDTTRETGILTSKENDCGSEGADLVTNSFPNSPSCVMEDDPDIDKLESNELEDILSQNMGGTENCSILKTMSSLALKDSINECLSQEMNGDEMDGELDLEGIDDAELDELILKEDEVKIKTLGWLRANAEFLKEKREKEERKARELLLNPKANKVKRKPRQPRPRMEYNSAQEALKQILKEKNLKDKVNYDILANFGLSPTKRKFEPCIDGQATEEQQSADTCQPPAEKKARIDLPEELSGVQKQEAESDDDQYYYDRDEQENQPNQQQEFEFQYEEPCEEFDNYYNDSD